MNICTSVALITSLHLKTKEFCSQAIMSVAFHVFEYVGIHVPPGPRLHGLHMDVSVRAEMYLTLRYRIRLCLYIICE